MTRYIMVVVVVVVVVVVLMVVVVVVVMVVVVVVVKMINPSNPLLVQSLRQPVTASPHRHKKLSSQCPHESGV